MKETTHFGYQTVDKDQKQTKVNHVFHSVASKYNLMNDIMSLGIHRLWKKITIDLANIQPNSQILDLAAGTGDLSIAMSKQLGKNGKLVVSDINSSMLNEAKKRLINLGIIEHIEFKEINAESIPFPDQSFDVVTIGFGLRNVTDKMTALKEMKRVLKPGGRLLILEFSKPKNPIFSKIYDVYSFNLLPIMGKVVAQDEESYRYLAESIRMHPDQETIKNMMLEASFDEVVYHNLTNGIVAIHCGFVY